MLDLSATCINCPELYLLVGYKFAERFQIHAFKTSAAVCYMSKELALYKYRLFSHDTALL